MKKAFLSIAAALAVAAASPAADPPLPKDVPTYLQDISVTIPTAILYIFSFTHNLGTSANDRIVL
jgi:hypothetical protein